MVTTCLIGCDPGVTVRPFWTDEPFDTDFLHELGEWGDLPGIRLAPGETVLKLSRHLHGGQVFTWIGLYRGAGSFKVRRKNTFMGAGFFLGEHTTAPGFAAFPYLSDVLGTFLATYAPAGRLTKAVVDIPQRTMPVPPSVRRLDDKLDTRDDAPGFGGGGLKSGATLFVDVGGGADPGEIVNCLEVAQNGDLFETCQTLLIGAAPDPEAKRLDATIKVVSYQKFTRPPPPPAPTPSPAPAREASTTAGPDYWRRSPIASQSGGPSFRPHTPPAPYAREDMRSTGHGKRVRQVGIVSALLFTPVLLTLLVMRVFPTLVWPQPPITLADPGNTGTPAPDPTETAAEATMSSAEAAAEKFFSTLNDSGDTTGLWSASQQATQPVLLAGLRRKVTSFEIAYRDAQQQPVNGKIEITLPFTATANLLDNKPWDSEGTILLRREASSADAPESWYVAKVKFARPPE